jgi:large subunit ribosomal protein L21
MYAVVETGGRQYRVQPGDTLDVELLGALDGATVELDRVLLVGGEGDTAVGQPLVSGARVIAEVVGEVRGPKIVVFKYKSKVRYRRKTGHRQNLTRLRVTEIRGGAR